MTKVAKQALKDMREMKLNTKVFNIEEINKLNSKLGI